MACWSPSRGGFAGGNSPRPVPHGAPRLRVGGDRGAIVHAGAALLHVVVIGASVVPGLLAGAALSGRLWTAPAVGAATLQRLPVVGRNRDNDWAWRSIAAAQAGVIARGQVSADGMTPGEVRGVIARERWQRLHHGIYVTHGGEVSNDARLWALALLHRPPFAFSHATAAALHGIYDRFPSVVHISVGRQRGIPRRPGVIVHRVEDLPLRIHPVLSPPRTTVEHTVIDLAHVAADPAQLVDVVMRACQRRLTTPARLFAVAARRPRLTRRSLFQEVLAQISDGAETPLERTYLLKVERAHGLPDGRRQVHAASAAGSVWRDVVYDEFSTVVELDGRRGHEDEPFRDYARDNRSLLTGLAPLRYGWHATVGNPCAVALEVARALRQRGWKGMPRPCGPGCPAEMMRASA